MCASHISASDGAEDPIDCLWRISRLPGADHPATSQVEPALGDALQRAVAGAVACHLRARASLARAGYVAAREAGSSALAKWGGLIAEIAQIDPALVSRAHAFHARLANRHHAAYREFARKQLLDLARCARLKTESLLAAITAGEGDPQAAAVALDGISLAWRADLPVRLPGLRAIELAAAGWYRTSGDLIQAEQMAARAATVSGVLSAYPEDAPSHWPKQPNQEELLRFAFAATRLSEAIEAWAPVEESSG
jgi:hypothetical protein